MLGHPQVALVKCCRCTSLHRTVVFCFCGSTIMQPNTLSCLRGRKWHVCQTKLPSRSQVACVCWYQAVKDAIHDALEDIDPSSVRGIGVSGQQHGLVALDSELKVGGLLAWWISGYLSPWPSVDCWHRSECSFGRVRASRVSALACQSFSTACGELLRLTGTPTCA